MKKLLLSLFLILAAAPVGAQTAAFDGVAPIETAAKQAILLDATTGTVLFAKDADSRMATSSMSKILTMYLVFEAIKNGKLKLDDSTTVSEYAWKQSGSRMFLNVGDRVKIEDLVRGVIIQSGNDAAVALAEAVGSTEGNFAAMMNAKAHELGMANSHFMNATGMPDPEHYSTARDLAVLAQAIMRDFPEDYHYFSEQEFTYNNIKQGNRNPLLYRNIGVDGLKTGHTEVAGFGLVASAQHDGRRMVLVVNGLNDMQERADEPAKLLDWGYREFGLYPVVKANERLAEAKVWLGLDAAVPLLAEKDVTLTLPRSARNGLKAVVTFDQPVEAPIVKGESLGKITVTAPGMTAVEVPLLAASDVARVGFFARVVAKLNVLLGRGA